MENRSHQGASYTTFKDLASASSCPCHPPLQWGRSRVITDDDPKARSTARAHRAHSWQTRLFVSKDALPELPHLVSADNGLRIVLRLLSATRRHLSGKFLGRWLRRANHESGMI